MANEFEGGMPPKEKKDQMEVRDAKGQIYKTIPLTEDELRQHKEEGWDEKESLVRIDVSRDDGKTWGTIAGRVSPEEAKDIIDRNLEIVDRDIRGKEDAENNRKELEEEGLDLTGYMTEIEERRESGSKRVWYFGGYYEADSDRLKSGQHPWIAYDGVNVSAFESPAEAKKWIKER